MTIAQDASTPAAVTQTGNTSSTITTASFTPPSNSLLVAIAGVGYNSNALSSTPTFSISDSVGGTWTTEATKFSPAGSTPDTLNGVFTKFVSSGVSQTVTLTTDTRQKGKQLKVLVLTGTATSNWTGNVDAVDGVALAHSFTTGTIGSWVIISAGENNNRTLVVNGSTTESAQLTDSSDAIQVCAGRMTTATVTPGAITLGWTGSSSNDVRTWVGVEIEPPAGGSASPVPAPAVFQLSTDDVSVAVGASAGSISVSATANNAVAGAAKSAFAAVAAVTVTANNVTRISPGIANPTAASPLSAAQAPSTAVSVKPGVTSVAATAQNAEISFLKPGVDTTLVIPAEIRITKPQPE